MATLQDLRQRIDDRPKYRYDKQTGDGASTKFQVSKYPIEPNTGTVTVGGSVYGSSAYTLNGTSGVIAFTSAPANGTQVLAEYTCTQIDGTTLQDILTRNGDVLDLAAAEALEMRAAGAAAYFEFVSGDVKINKSQVATNYMKLAEQIRKNYYEPDRMATVDTQVEWHYQDQDQTGD